MKLSQMNTEQLADALCAMAEPIDKIGMDEAFTEKLKEVAERGKLNKIQNATTMFATRYERDPLLSVNLVSVSTLLAIITMPIIIALTQYLGSIM